MEERRKIVRRRADRELYELVEQKTGLKPGQLVRQRKMRRAIRHTCKAVLQMPVAHAAGETQDWQTDRHDLKARVLDLSEGGAALFSKYELRPGHRLHIAIKLYDGQAIEAEVEVRWAKYKDQKEGWAVGLQFTDIDAKNQKRLDTFLAELDATLGLGAA